MKARLRLIGIAAINFLVGVVSAAALTPGHQSEQAHCLALSSNAGLATFGSAKSMAYFVPMATFRSLEPPPGQHLPNHGSPYSLVVSRGGTLWIGMVAGLVSRKEGKLTQYPEFDEAFVASLREDCEVTVWAGTVETHGGLSVNRSSRARRR